MHTISLAGLPYHALSPSHFELAHAPAAICFDGTGWVVGTAAGWGARHFPSRDAAATLIARAFAGEPVENLA
jgi:hypothetical protein